ncbi:MAG: glycosyltransferase family 9 protein [Candidatus Omnitrophica bacterium]|nr:glycosyltransferase family 9 protein [Candidatus Omnitrophota bacterium]
MSQRFLIISLSNIGDVVLTTPVIMRIAQAFPQALLTVVAGPKAAPLAAASRRISRWVVYDKRASWPEKLRFAADLRRDRYEAVIDLRNTAIPFLVSARRRSPSVRFHKEISMRERHLEVLRWTGYRLQEEAPTFDFYHPEEEASALRKMREAGIPQGPFILIAAGAASSAKRWPLKRYDETLRRLLALHPGPAVLIGDSSERSYVQDLVSADPSRVFNMAGLTTLRETASLIGRCELLLTNDSAAMHLGHEMRRKVAAVFGPTSWQAYGRSGPLWRLLKPEPEDACCASGGSDAFAGVTAEKVFDACRELLTLPQDKTVLPC